MLARSLLSCCTRCCPAFRAVTTATASGFTPSLQPIRLLRTDFRACAAIEPPWKGRESVRKRLQAKFRITMSEEEKARKLKAIEQARQEKPPDGLIAKLKFYIKRYWYIAVPVHTINCTMWYVALYLAVRSGIDVIQLLESLHMPSGIIEKVKGVPPSAGYAVIALLLYKLAIPFRYATTIALVQVTFQVLKKFGWLRTAREIEYHVRSRYEPLNQRRFFGAYKLINREKEKPARRKSNPPAPKTK